MSTFPIDWHRDCLKNMRENLVRRMAELERLRVSIERFAGDIDHLEKQIARAEKLKKTSFDSDKFFKRVTPDARG